MREQELMKKFGWEEEFYQGRISQWMKYKPKIWALFDEPYSSQAAKVLSQLIVLFTEISLRLFIIIIYVRCVKYFLVNSGCKRK